MLLRDGPSLEASRPIAVQRSFDDLGTALVDTTFCVFDLETTGGSADGDRITEIGAVKVRGGEVLGEFDTLVNPGIPIPLAISVLTNITDAMVLTAPPIESVLPAFAEFAGDAVLVAHNASFDTRFMAATLARHGYPAMDNPVVCTVRLARRLVRDEVPNLQLATLARALRARTEPTHRALADARATTDVLHALLELAGRYGVGHIDDLLWFQRIEGHPSAGKLRLTDGLPRARGVYLFRDGSGRVLYVGKATDLRTRVRSYFGSDDRRRIGDLLRAVEVVDHIVCPTDLDASTLEARLIRAHAPPFNRAGRGRATQWYLKLTTDRFPRLSAATQRPDDRDALGPVGAPAAAAVREALEEAADTRTCTQRIAPSGGGVRCVRGQIGRCGAPCEAAITPERYAAVAEPVARALAGDPSEIVRALAERMDRLADERRFEEAQATRERLGALIEATRSTRAIGSLVAAGALDIAVGGTTISLRCGILTAVDGRPLPVQPDDHPDEIRLVAAWLARNARRARVVRCDGEWAAAVAGGALLARWAERFRTLRSAGSGAARPDGDPAPAAADGTAARTSRRSRTPSATRRRSPAASRTSPG